MSTVGMMNYDVIEMLKHTARQSCFFDPDEDGEDGEECTIWDHCGGNVDDAFQSGVTAGETAMARQVLSAMGISW